MDRAVRNIGQKLGYDSLFSEIKPLFDSADIVAVNLEGPITSNPSKTLVNGHTTDSLTFTFDPAVATSLSNAGIKLVSLANNHSDNFGLSGIAETKKWLTKSNIAWFGDYKNASSTEATVTKNNISVAFVGYHAFQPGFEKVLASVSNLSNKGYFVIVMPHWGVEYATSSTREMRSQARLLVASGASAILGSHPHVVMEHVEMGDIPVFYSLGNLLFDQYFSAGVMTGNIVELDLSKKNGATKLDNIKIFQTSTSSHQNITVNMKPMDF
jgi:poly-gamma-glutamate synthesis protein (capsule biosynthesis protein)